jgi:hypothetical protein
MPAICQDNASVNRQAGNANQPDNSKRDQDENLSAF